MEDLIENNIPEDIIKKVERDLKCYPDWIIRLEVGGLGITSKAYCNTSYSFSAASIVEFDTELSDETKKKIVAIEKVYDRLRGNLKDFVDYKYFKDYKRYEILEILKISKKRYYNLKDYAIECFARALGYIE